MGCFSLMLGGQGDYISPDIVLPQINIHHVL
jgi:hypothetical protein